MSAISPDMHANAIEAAEQASPWQDAEHDIRCVLNKREPVRQLRSVYFGDDTVDLVRCVLSVREPRQAYGWFGPRLRDISVLRIEDDDFPHPAVDAVTTIN